MKQPRYSTEAEKLVAQIEEATKRLAKKRRQLKAEIKSRQTPGRQARTRRTRASR